MALVLYPSLPVTMRIHPMIHTEQPRMAGCLSFPLPVCLLLATEDE